MRFASGDHSIGEAGFHVNRNDVEIPRSQLAGSIGPAA
jgi:hypothetical protein